MSPVVFADARAGDIVPFGIVAGQRGWSDAARRLPPLGAVVVGDPAVLLSAAVLLLVLVSLVVDTRRLDRTPSEIPVPTEETP